MSSSDYQSDFLEDLKRSNAFNPERMLIACMLETSIKDAIKRKDQDEVDWLESPEIYPFSAVWIMYTLGIDREAFLKNFRELKRKRVVKLGDIRQENRYTNPSS